MAVMTELKLLALDDEDLQIISAHMQDSVFKAADLEWHGKRGHFCLVVNRFAWEKAERATEGFERRKAALSFKRVQAVRTLGINRQDDQTVFSLLAIRFIRKDDGPDGTIELTLAGGSAISLDVECIEAQLADTGGVWGTENRPKHEV